MFSVQSFKCIDDCEIITTSLLVSVRSEMLAVGKLHSPSLLSHSELKVMRFEHSISAPYHWSNMFLMRFVYTVAYLGLYCK